MEPSSAPAKVDPLETSPPAMTPTEAEEMVRRAFGVAGRASLLASERDQNFRVDSDRGSFLLKISNRADDAGVLDMQTQALLHVSRCDPSLPVMEPVRALDGVHHGEIVDPDGNPHLVRLFTFLPGRIISSADLDHAALEHFGAIVARMGIALRGFFHPAAGYRILWDLKHTSDLRPMLEDIAEDEGRGRVERVLDRFDEVVAPALPRLRGQVIHNDLTLDNVLLDADHRVSGIVDFGDLTHTALVCDLAIALVSAMWGRTDPLEAARATIAGYVSVAPIEDAEADVLADLAGARLAALIVIAHRRVRRYPENRAYIMANVDLAWRLLEHFDALGWSEVKGFLRAACRPRPSTSMRRARPPTVDELLDRRRRVLGPALSPLTYDPPLYLVRGDGVHMYDHRGTPYLDAYNNVPVVGHSHPRVTAAIAEQSATLNTNTRYLHESVVELAERLTATMPAGLDTVMFFNSGSEANDIAWRLATAYTEGTGAIVTAHAYHGVTTATIALSPEEWPRDERPSHVATIPAPDTYRGAYGDLPGWEERYAEHVDEAVSTLESRGIRPAAMFADALFTSDGIFRSPARYLQDVVRRVHAAGGLFVADEVQCGFGRSGSHLWSFEASGIVPDVVTLGKPMGNGHPVAAVATRSEIVDRFASTTHLFSTFGGNPVACRAGLAVLDVIEDEKLVERADDVGEHLHTELDGLRKIHDRIGDVRGAGLLIGVELVCDENTREPDPRLARAAMNRMRDRGVLVGATGPKGNVLKIRPPLVLTKDHADAITGALDRCLAEIDD